jgi:hypothetical protein
MTESWIFRGVGDSSYELQPKIGRPGTWKDIRTGADLGYSADLEKRSLERFKREAAPHMAIQPTSDLEWLSIAQHYGLPTCLLDWSESPLVAAFFALLPGGFIGKEPKDAAIYGLPCPATVTTDKNLCTTPKEVVAYFPQHLTPRITAQRGVFTYHKHPDRPYKADSLVKWVLPWRICFDLKVILNKCGFTEASMFPDLGGVARHAAWLLKWRLL